MTRDTDADWARIAETEPFFGVLANPEFLSENRDDAAEERFFASGESDIAFVVDTVRHHLDPQFAPRRAVDFGCGVGRLSLAMARVATHVTGVDVAPEMRRIATERAVAAGVTNVGFGAEIPASADWVNSLIVLQHIVPERGYELIARMLDVLEPGGVFSVQITTHRDARHMTELLRDVSVARYDGREMKVFATKEADGVGHMSMFDYDLGRVFALLVGRGFERMWIQHTDHAGVHGAWIFASKAG